MVRPPCCDKGGVKKGPWTPEEDIILVTYIQEHGPGNWRAVPTNTGEIRASRHDPDQEPGANATQELGSHEKTYQTPREADEEYG
ncbi:hypothetical protein F2Q70_00018434 [Brassica cretica]|uniref:Myb-like domain-containing protein n=1 Tax=Brassica cretica TaxID=69181 RepID=A0A8S9HSV8_BRACR|nr:hypothetical protein F2Q70_00018434 [Brassica cretica]